jgi:hypothetical protein
MMKFVLILILGFAGMMARAETQASYDFVQVSGEGEIKIKPEYVLITTTVFSRAQQAQAAQKNNAKEMARIDKILKQDFKIDAKDIQTSSFQVAPQYEYQQNKSVYRGVMVSHMLTIKYRKTDDIGNLLDRLLEGQSQEGFGVRIEGITFGSDQMRSMQAQALEQAVTDARNRATILAKAGGKTLKSVRKISDSQIRAGGFQPMREMKMGGMAATDMASSTAISPGELSVTANVQVEFEIQ